MQFNEIELTNLCCFQHLHVRPQPGLTCIVGPNGAGKSSLMDLVLALLINEYPREGGNKDENIRYHSQGPALGRLCGTHHGQTFRLQRGLRRAASEFVVDAGEPVVGDDRVTAAVLDFLGVEKRTLTEFVFVRQSKIVDALDQQSLFRLFHLDWAETVRKELLAQQKTVRLDDQTSLLRELEQQLKDETNTKANLLRDLRQHEDLHTATERAAQYADQIAAGRTRLQDAERVVGQLTERMRGWEDADRAQRSRQQLLDSWATADRRLVALETEIAEALREEPKVTPKLSVAEDAELRAAEETCKRLESQICKECLRPYDSAQEPVETLQAKIREASDTAARLYKIKFQHHREYEAHAQWERGVLRLRQERDRLTRERSDRDDRAATTPARSNSGRAELEAELRDAKAEVARETAQLKDVEQTAERLRRDGAWYAQLHDQYDGVQGRIDKLNERRAAAETKQRKFRCDSAWLARSDDLRAKLHPDALPRAVTRKFMEELLVLCAERLQAFGDPFRVHLEDSLDVTVELPDGRVQPAKRLSFGQRTVLWLAMRLAIYDRFAGGLGQLWIDEPTAYLDADAADCVLPAIDYLRQLGRQQDLQCFVITHRRSLQSHFDHTLALGPHGAT